MPGGDDILKGVGSYLQNRSANKQAQADRESQMNQLIAAFLGGQQQNRVAATQMDPFKQAKSRNSLNVKRSSAAGLKPGGYSSGPVDMSALDPSNLDQERSRFDSIVNDPETERMILEYLRKSGGMK
jgi:hypothetical protein